MAVWTLAWAVTRGDPSESLPVTVDYWGSGPHMGEYHSRKPVPWQGLLTPVSMDVIAGCGVSPLLRMSHCMKIVCKSLHFKNALSADEASQRVSPTTPLTFIRSLAGATLAASPHARPPSPPPCPPRIGHWLRPALLAPPAPHSRTSPPGCRSLAWATLAELPCPFLAAIWHDAASWMCNRCRAHMMLVYM